MDSSVNSLEICCADETNVYVDVETNSNNISNKIDVAINDSKNNLLLYSSDLNQLDNKNCSIDEHLDKIDKINKIIDDKIQLNQQNEIILSPNIDIFTKKELTQKECSKSFKNKIKDKLMSSKRDDSDKNQLLDSPIKIIESIKDIELKDETDDDDEKESDDNLKNNEQLIKSKKQKSLFDKFLDLKNYKSSNVVEKDDKIENDESSSTETDNLIELENCELDDELVVASSSIIAESDNTPKTITEIRSKKFTKKFRKNLFKMIKTKKFCKRCSKRCPKIHASKTVLDFTKEFTAENLFENNFCVCDCPDDFISIKNHTYTEIEGVSREECFFFFYLLDFLFFYLLIN